MLILYPKTNPTNVPQIRPIEDFFGMLSSIVYAGGWEAKSHENLERRIKPSLGKINRDSLQRMFERVPLKIRRLGRYGPYHQCH
jgi:hypothetical protein